ncbi:hypothetical protein CLOM_g286 [Closterium sp. NIES-68]|nr:hypothetical protein CLOM_g286 [Closterium sp. NIES-68]GJP76424.1 hypothetical protein CLOP_g6874 [Closterium sp. NIES-67]
MAGPRSSQRSGVSSRSSTPHAASSAGNSGAIFAGSSASASSSFLSRVFPALAVSLLALAAVVFAFTYSRPSLGRCDLLQLQLLGRQGGDLGKHLKVLEKQMNYNKKLVGVLQASLAKLAAADSAAAVAEADTSAPADVAIPANASMRQLVEVAAQQVADEVRASMEETDFARLRHIVGATVRRTGKWTAALAARSCPQCPECSLTPPPTIGPVCTAPGFVNCSCPNGQSGRRKFPKRTEKPLCTDGASPGRWKSYSQWEADNCQYRDISTDSLRECLKGKWIHFFGDSLSRLLANEFARQCGMQRRSWDGDKTRSTLLDTRADQQVAEGGKGGGGGRRRRLSGGGPLGGGGEGGGAEGGWWNGGANGGNRAVDGAWSGLEGGVMEEWEAPEEVGGGEEEGKSVGDERRLGGRRRLLMSRDEWPRVTYLFRGKMAHQRHPEENTTEERDLNNKFLQSFKQPGGQQPDFLIMSMGAHEVIGWNRRPPPDLDVATFKKDTEELLQLLRGTYNRDKGMLLWWKAHYIWPGKVTGKDYFTVRQYHEIYQAYAYKRFQEEGYTTADFYQTTEDRPELIWKPDGVHYGSEALAVHSKILANTLCNKK